MSHTVTLNDQTIPSFGRANTVDFVVPVTGCVQPDEARAMSASANFHGEPATDDGAIRSSEVIVPTLSMTGDRFTFYVGAPTRVTDDDWEFPVKATAV